MLVAADQHAIVVFDYLGQDSLSVGLYVFPYLVEGGQVLLSLVAFVLDALEALLFPSFQFLEILLDTVLDGGFDLFVVPLQGHFSVPVYHPDSFLRQFLTVESTVDRLQLILFLFNFPQ